MHAVRTPVFGIGFAVVLLVLETLGARPYISDRLEQPTEVQRRVRRCDIERGEKLARRPIPKACFENILAKDCW